MSAPTRLGPNERLPCGTWSAYVRHLAHGQDCMRCGTDRPVPERYPGDHPKDQEAICPTPT